MRSWLRRSKLLDVDAQIEEEGGRMAPSSMPVVSPDACNSFLSPGISRLEPLSPFEP